MEETRVSLRTRPIVLILHGVNGHGNESYMRHLAHVVAEVQFQSINIRTQPPLPNTYIPTITPSLNRQRGWRAAVMTMRGCGDLTLSTPKAYDACKTEDLDLAVSRIHKRYPQAPLFLVGCV